MSLINDTLREYEEKLQAVYRERDMILAVAVRLARLYGYVVGHALDDKTNWEDDWRNIIYLELPTGQCSWHIQADEMIFFPRLPGYGRAWDGHSTEEKYHRIERYVS